MTMSLNGKYAALFMLAICLSRASASSEATPKPQHLESGMRATWANPNTKKDVPVILVCEDPENDKHWCVMSYDDCEEHFAKEGDLLTQPKKKAQHKGNKSRNRSRRGSNSKPRTPLTM